MWDSLKFYAQYKIVAIYDLPKSWQSISNISQDLKKLNINYYTISFIPTAVLVFRNSCHICQTNYKNIFDFDYCLLLTVLNDDVESITENIKVFHSNSKTALICQTRLQANLICPSMIEQLKEKNDICGKLLDIVEKWFSDEEIYKHKEILVSMNNNGWVPLTVLETKLAELIIISTQEIIDKLKKSILLEIDSTEMFVRRKNKMLPFSSEHKQIVLLDIPDMIKSVRQLPAYLQLDENCSVEYFEYAIHSAIVTLQSRENAAQLVTEVMESGKMKAKLLVPRISEDGDDGRTSRADVLDMGKVLASLALKQEPSEQIHVMRLTPSDLAYAFQEGFVAPGQSMIDKIVKQVNFYFSDANVLKDLFILKKIKSNPGGWIDSSVVASFKQVVRLSAGSVDNVVFAMCSSDQVQISRDGRSLRRRLPLPEWDSSIYIRSLFLWNLPKLCDSYEKLDQVFREEGRFVVNVSRYIRAERNVPADLRKLVDKIPALGKHHCGVVEFSSREAMLSAEEFVHLKWASVKTFFLDTKEELPKPAVIVGKSSRLLPPPIPVSTFLDDRVAPLQAGTRIDPRFWQVAKLLSSKKRAEMKIYSTDNGVTSAQLNIGNSSEFPPLARDDPARPVEKPWNKKPLGQANKNFKAKTQPAGQQLSDRERKPKPNKKLRKSRKENSKLVENSENGIIDC